MAVTDALHMVFDGKAAGHGEIRPAGGLDAENYLRIHAGAVLKAPAVLVGAAVEQLHAHLVAQITAVGGHDVHAVRTALFAELCGLDMRLYDAVYLVRRHRATPTLGIPQVCAVGGGDQIALHGHWKRDASEAAPQLDEQLAAVFVHTVCQLCQLLSASGRVGEGRIHGGAVLHMAVAVAGVGVDETHAALCALDVIADGLIRPYVVFGLMLGVHGGHHHAVLHMAGADVEGLEQLRIFEIFHLHSSISPPRRFRSWRML